MLSWRQNQAISNDPSEKTYSPCAILARRPIQSAIGRPLIWAWEMTNQQGYLDGIQLEFAEDVSAESVVVQLRIREISSDFI